LWFGNLIQSQEVICCVSRFEGVGIDFAQKPDKALKKEVIESI
jgi:hypothetical protein